MLILWLKSIFVHQLYYFCDSIKQSEEEAGVDDEEYKRVGEDKDIEVKEEEDKTGNEQEESKNKVNARERGDGQVRHLRKHT